MSSHPFLNARGIQEFVALLEILHRRFQQRYHLVYSRSTTLFTKEQKDVSSLFEVSESDMVKQL